MFIGTTFFCGKHTLLPPATNVTNIKSLSITNGKYDRLYLTADSSETLNEIDDGWTYDTKLDAHFEKDLEAGSIGFSTRNTDTIVIKTREKGSFDWKTIYSVPIKTNDDFNFIKNYAYSRNFSVNEYLLVSMVNNIENSYVLTEERTEFEGYFIVDRENIYGTIFNIESTDTIQNIGVTTLPLLNDKYPSVYTNADTNYTSGTTSGCFLKFDFDKNEADIKAGVMYRQEVMQWICNGKPKILKLEDGRIFLIKVVGQPSDTGEGHMHLRRISFDWVEIGDVNDMKTLYMNNLSEIGQMYW